MSDEDIVSSPIHPLLAAALAKGGSVHTDAEAIVEAIVIGDEPSVAEILRHCRDLDGTLNNAASELWTPLEVAAGYGRLDIIRLLIERGADLRCHSRHCGGPLFRAFEDSQADAVRLLLDLGADPNARDAPSFGGDPALISAVWWAGEARHNGSDGAAAREIVQALLDHGADANAVHDGKTALMTAVNNAGPDPEIVRLLLARGANIHACDPDGGAVRDLARSLVEGAMSRGHTPRPEAIQILKILEDAYK